MSFIKVNMNKSNDPNYRYKITPLKTQYGGGGQFTITYINNIEVVANEIGHPKKIILKFLALLNGSNDDDKTNSIKGTINEEIIQDGFLSYLNEFIFCNKCNIPECNLIIKKNKKKELLYKKCSGCGAELEYNSTKKTNKISAIIIKELKNGTKFEKMKGVVEEEEDFTNDLMSNNNFI